MVNYFGVCTGWGASGSWIIQDSQPTFGWQGNQGSQGNQGMSAQLRSNFSSGAPCWVPASSGEVPPEAVQGGMDGEYQINPLNNF